METHALPAPKCLNACSYCRARKVKCTGGSRCKNCVVHSKECIYPVPQRNRLRKDYDERAFLERRLAQIDAILISKGKAQELTGPVKDSSEYHQLQGQVPVLSNQDSSQLRQGVQNQNSLTSPPQDSHSHELVSGRGFRERSNSLSQPMIRSQQSAMGYSVTASDQNKDESNTDTPDMPLDNEESIISPYNVNWEHHGPGSWLSICSNPGIKWVSERTGVSDFAQSAQGLSMGWTKRLKLQQTACRERAPELDPETAWEYSRAYFEECYYSVFGIVHRPDFESRLRAQFSKFPGFEDDPSWFALRNTVYASGCRIVLAKDLSVSFTEAQARAWRFFENALSVHTELLYTPTGLTAVQALALMSYYLEGLGSPTLGYMLCSSATRLAHSKGLHRRAANGWNLPISEILHRNWLFWAIYCCEKAIINRSGRPSAIDDDDISCQIPTTVVQGSTIDIDIFTNAIKHAQIASRISKKLFSVSAFQKTTTELIETVSLLDKQLQEWRDNLPASLKIRDPRELTMPSSKRSKINIYYIHFAYYGSLIAMHSIFIYPWITAIFGIDLSHTFKNQVSISMETLADASRSILLTSRFIEINVASPSWLVFYYPMVGLINLFVSILKSPSSLVAPSDVSLMDIAVGHFGHLDFITSSELEFPFTREVAALARATVKKARERDLFGNIVQDENWNNGVRNVPDVDPWDDLNYFNSIDFDMEGWNVFFSVPIEGMTGGDDVSLNPA